LKTAQLENPKLITQLIEVDSDKGIIEKLKESSRCAIDNRIRYVNGKRQVSGWSEVGPIGEGTDIPWKDDGVYLITGGAGGLGLIFAKEIAGQAKNACLILTGRSALTEARQSQIEEIRRLGARMEYQQTDTARLQAVDELIREIKEKFGGLNGIIHSAGMIRDNFILKKSIGELQEILDPKVTGLVNLDRASKDLPLDFFIFFSSMAGALGNPGQADYAAANAFMDAYAGYRNQLVSSKQRHGQTVSINWPLWKAGGMKVDEEAGKMLRKKTGIIPMETKTGIRAFYQGLSSGLD